VSDRAGARDIYAINADGTGEQRLTTGAIVDIAVWSPDGTRIAYGRSVGLDGAMDIFTMNADGTNAVNVTNNPAADNLPSWSPDGRRIAFMSYRAGGASQIYAMSADGTGVTQLTTDAQGDNEAPDWSPDGTRITFMSNRDAGSLATIYQVYTMNSDGSAVARVTSELLDAELPTWSPDGSKVLFTSLEGTTRSIVVTAPDGSGRTVLANGLDSPYPHWQAIPTTYAFSGFFPPVANPPTLNIAKAGRAIPVRFSLGGDRGLNIFAAGSPSSQRVTCNAAPRYSLVSETSTAKTSSLTYDAPTGRYRYLWATDVRWAGSCRELTLALKDGSTHRATFAFVGDDD
jgi:Tol biopolymer transport system component